MRKPRSVIALATFLLATVAPLGSFATQAVAQDVLENLDEMFRRKARQGDVSIPAERLEDATTYVWQPETLCYTDVNTGHEVWVLVRGPNEDSLYSKEYATNAWSYNGDVIGVSIMPARPTRNREIQPHDSRFNYWLVKTTGAYLKASEGPTSNARGSGGSMWGHTEAAFYAFIDAKLYKMTVDEKNVVATKMILDTAGADAKFGLPPSKKSIIKRGISGNDMYLSCSARASQDYGRRLRCRGHMRIRLGEEPRVLDYWGVNRDCGEYGRHKRGNESKFHSGATWPFGFKHEYMHGMYAGAIFYQFKVTGSDPKDGGPVWEDWDGDSYGKDEIIPISNGRDPALNAHTKRRWAGYRPHPSVHHNYWGHPSFDRWEKYVLFGTGDPRPGTRISEVHNPEKGFDGTTGQFCGYIGKGYYDGTHHSWAGWTDHVVASLRDGFMYGAKIYPKLESYKICSTHTNRGGNYTALPRPSQSPDGTKVAVSMTFLQAGGSRTPHVCWVVAYYPYPPTDLKAAPTAEGGVKLTWKTPSYSVRGWPEENKDPPPPAREIRAFHVWRAEDAAGPWREIGMVNVQYKLDKETGINHPINLEFAERPPDGTWYYALTSEEFSRLESRELSEVLKVTLIDGEMRQPGSIAAKGGQKDFWQRPPAAPKNVVSEKSDTPGHYQLSWAEPDDSKVRYYNIYYSAAGAPQVSQQCRIASLPVGTTRYLDWLADAAAPGSYVVTSVDRQGNESAPVPAVRQ